MGHAKIQIRHVNMSYNDSNGTILYVEDLEVYNGELVFFLGQSGVGKSSLLESIGVMNDLKANGNDSKSYYQLCFEDKTYDYLKIDEASKAIIRKEYLSFVFQENNLMSNFNVADNILLTAYLSQKNDARDQQINVLLKELGLNTSRLKDDITSFSGGQKQRIAFIRALVKNHEILIGDEPTASLDPVNAQRVLNKCQELVKENKTVLIITHNITQALSYANKIVLFNYNGQHGEILKENIYTREEINRWTNSNGRTLSSEELTAVILDKL